MLYYLLIPADRTYQGNEGLTYSSHEPLQSGQIVVVTLRSKKITAITIRDIQKPQFKVKPIDTHTSFSVLPYHLQLLESMRTYYPSGLGALGSLFTPPNLQKSRALSTKSDVNNKTDFNAPPPLTNQQAATINQILTSPVRTHIVHGDTGTGKTRVYLELAQAVLRDKKSVIILTPEISLTPQLSEQFSYVFANCYTAHSKLTNAKRRELWMEIYRDPKPKVIIGPRSALFYPIADIGLIVVDEFHDVAYKQEQAPRYHAVRVAAQLSRHAGCQLILGSATPPIEDYFYATHKGAQLHRITDKPIMYSSEKRFHIVDLSQNESHSSEPLLSPQLINLVNQKLLKKEQSLLFLNKRGTSRQILCNTCGWQAQCDRCNIPFTYHYDFHQLLCHTCGFKADAPHGCPICNSADIIYKSPGTKAIYESLHRLFPNAIIGRYDKDNTKLETFSANHGAIKRGEIDILVGTQLLIKGHDLPRLSLVAVLLAENNLNFPDYTSHERSFQLLHQITGRVGRSTLDGDIVLQTYQPGSPFLLYAEHHKNAWSDFYSKELIERKTYNFPPFCSILKIEVSRARDKNAESAATKIADNLRRSFNSIEVLGPAPSFKHKQNDRWYWHIIIKSSRRSTLLDVIKLLPSGCTYDIDPTTLL